MEKVCLQFIVILNKQHNLNQTECDGNEFIYQIRCLFFLKQIRVITIRVGMMETVLLVLARTGTLTNVHASTVGKAATARFHVRR